LFGCAKEKKITEENLNTAGEMQVDQKVLQFDLVAYTDKGIKKWEVKGNSANLVDETIELTNIIATTYGEEEATLKSDEGIYDKEANKVSLKKNVVVTTQDGGTLLTEAIDWDSKDNIITTDKLVEIRRDQIRLYGTGVKGEPQLKRVQFKKEITVEMEEGATVMTCDGPLNIDYEKNLAIFNNNVKIVDEKGEVASDRLDAYLNPETKVIAKAIAIGSVKISRDDNYSHSEAATYLLEEHKVVLTGRPQLVIYPDQEFDASFFGGDSE